MTSSHNTKSSIPSFIRDSVVFRLSRPLDVTRCTGVEDGRYIFMMSNPKVSDLSAGLAMEEGRGMMDDQSISFEIDVFDLLLSKSTHFGSVTDLYSFGKCAKFYALDKRNLVIVDLHSTDNVLRQRLITIDWEEKTAQCHFYRTYTMRPGLDNEDSIFTTIGDELAVTITNDSALLHPTNPLKLGPHRDISALSDQAEEYACEVYRRGEVDPDDVSLSFPPFIISNTAIGYFLGINNFTDLSTAVIIDLTRDSFYLQDITTSSSSFPPSTQHSGSLDVSQKQANDKEVVVRCRIYDDIVQFGTLNTRTLHWTKGVIETGDEDPSAVPFNDGNHIVLFSMASVVGRSRMSWKVNGEEEQDDTMFRFQLVRNPLRVSSLLRLATIAVQKSGRLTTQQLQQIADRL